MTWEKAQSAAYESTEIIINNRKAIIEKAYRDAYKTISGQLKNLYLLIQENGIPKGEYYNYMSKYNRLDMLQESIAKQYKIATTKGLQSQSATNAQAFTDMYYKKQYLLNWVDDVDHVYAFVNDDVLRTATTSNISFWKKIPEKWGQGKNFIISTGKTVKHYLSKGNVAALEAITDAVTSGFIAGDSYAKTARALRPVFDGAKNHALLVAQTEGGRMLNAASLANTNIARSEGVEIVRQWDATLDSKTRPTHTRADGQRENKEGLFTVGAGTGPYPCAISEGKENYRCRCGVIDIIDGVNPQIRRARNPVTGETDIIDFKDFNTWAEDNNLKWSNKGWIKS